MLRLLALLMVTSVVGVSGGGVVAHNVAVDTASGEVSFRAVYRPSQFNSSRGLKNHHLITWQGGNAGKLALLVSLSTDSAVHDALVAAGARPGNNLTLDSWNTRANPKSRDPDVVADGSPLSITIETAGRVWLPESLLTDQNQRPEDFVFAGNRAFIPAWKSGCVVCLQSCPGSKISNRSYTIRELYRGIPQFAVRAVTGLRDGDTVTVRIRAKVAP